MNRSDYENYLKLFNARDYDGVIEHWADEFELVFSGYVFRKPEEIRKLYAFLHAHVEEKVTLKKFVSDDTIVALEADVRIEAFKDMTLEALKEHGLERLGELKKGQVIVMPQFIHYHLENGKIVKGMCAIYEPPHE